MSLGISSGVIHNHLTPRIPVFRYIKLYWLQLKLFEIYKVVKKAINEVTAIFSRGKAEQCAPTDCLDVATAPPIQISCYIAIFNPREHIFNMDSTIKFQNNLITAIKCKKV